MTPTQSQIRDAQKYFHDLCKAMAIEASNAFPEVQTIETILQSALDTQKPTGDAGEAEFNTPEYTLKGVFTTLRQGIASESSNFKHQKLCEALDFITRYKAALTGDCGGGDFPYQRTFDAIRKAVTVKKDYSLSISVEAFQESYNKALTADNAKRGEE